MNNHENRCPKKSRNCDPIHTRAVHKKGTKKFSPIDGNMMDLNKTYLPLPSYLKKSVENSQ